MSNYKSPEPYPGGLAAPIKLQAGAEWEREELRQMYRARLGDGRVAIPAKLYIRLLTAVIVLDDLRWCTERQFERPEPQRGAP